METFVDDIGSFPLPVGIKRDDYAKAYEMARDMLNQGQNPYTTYLWSKPSAKQS